MSAYSVRPYRSGDERGILASFAEAFGERRTLDEWRWRFQFEAEPTSIAIAEGPAGEIVSQYAVIPLPVEVEGVPIGAGQPVDVFCLRRPGSTEGLLYVRTYREFVRSFCGRDRRFQVLFGFPHDRALRQGQLKMGYPADPPQVPALSVPVAGPLGSLVRRMLARAGTLGGDSPDGEEIDRLWKRCRHRYPIAVVRDGRWLYRRFLSRPRARYLQLLEGDADRLRAWSVLRRVGWEMRWADLLWDGTRETDLLSLLRRAQGVARRVGCRRLVLWLAGDAQASEVLTAGGLRPRAGRGLRFAHRFYDRKRDDGEAFARRFYVTLGISDLV